MGEDAGECSPWSEGGLAAAQDQTMDPIPSAMDQAAQLRKLAEHHIINTSSCPFVIFTLPVGKSPSRLPKPFPVALIFAHRPFAPFS